MTHNDKLTDRYPAASVESKVNKQTTRAHGRSQGAGSGSVRRIVRPIV